MLCRSTRTCLMTIECEYINKALRLEFAEKNNKLYFRSRPCCHMHGDLIDNQYKQWKECNSWEDIEFHENSLFFKQWSMKEAGWHPACHPCELAESSGSRSPRFILSPDENVDYHLLDVVIGNTCNLACPFCAPNVSSLIEKMASTYDGKLPGKWGNDPEINANPTLVSSIISDFIDNRRVSELKIIGGEPLLSDNWSEFEKLILSGRCSDMQLTFTTNGTVMNSRVIDSLKSVKSSKITVSIDSINENYEFIRWPYKWNKLQDNLKFLFDNKPSSTHVHIDALVNIFNFELLPEITQVFNQWPSTNFMTDLKPKGSELDFKVLPLEILEYVYENIEGYSNLRAEIKTVIDNYDDMNLLHLKNKTVWSVNWFLKQRSMTKAVLGAKTQQYLGL